MVIAALDGDRVEPRGATRGVGRGAVEPNDLQIANDDVDRAGHLNMTVDDRAAEADDGLVGSDVQPSGARVDRARDLNDLGIHSADGTLKRRHRRRGPRRPGPPAGRGARNGRPPDEGARSRRRHAVRAAITAHGPALASPVASAGATASASATTPARATVPA